MQEVPEQKNHIQSYQLIDHQKRLNIDAFHKIIQPISSCNKNYYTCAIIGAQNTGKSTLLNVLFKTNFQVLQGHMGDRTTRGVVLGRDYAQNFIVMDVEGNDSYQNHIQGSDNFQRMISSFALVAANILVVNIKAKSIGQHTGSQYQTLGTVMRICIDQFKQQSPKTILFVLRDTDVRVNHILSKNKLEEDVKNIWRNVWTGTKVDKQLEKYQDKPQRFFTIQTHFLRKYDQDYPQDFQEDVKALRQRFVNQNHEQYLFKKQKRQFNLPINDYQTLLKNVWNKIITNKQLNLPNQKIQIANYRCQQISNEIKKKYQIILNQSKKKKTNFKQDLINKIKQQFNNKCNCYNHQIKQKWLQQTITYFLPKIQQVVRQIISHRQSQIKQEFNNKLKHVFYDQKKSFNEQSKQILNQKIKQFIIYTDSLQFQLQDRETKINKLTQECNDMIKLQIEQKIKDSNRQFQEDSRRKIQSLSARIVKQHFTEQFWFQVNKQFKKLTKVIIDDLDHKYLWARGYSIVSSEIDKSVQKMQNLLKQHLKQKLQISMKNGLFDYFKKNFYYDHHDQQYNFNILEVEQIAQRYNEAKQMTQNLLDTLNQYTLNEDRRGSYIMQKDIQNENIKNKNGLLDDRKLLDIKQIFNKSIRQQYETIMRRRNDNQSKKMPWYFFLIIIFFCYDDICFPAKEYPFMHYSLIFLIIIGLLPYAIGQGTFIEQLINVIAQNFHKLFSNMKQKKANKRQ